MNEYMKLLTREDERFGEGRAEGIVEGEQRAQRSIYERLIADGMPAQKASAMTGWAMA